MRWQLHNIASIFNTREQHLEVGGFLCSVYLGTTGKLFREEMVVIVWRQYCRGMLGVRSASTPILLPLVPKASAGDRCGSGIRMSRPGKGKGQPLVPTDLRSPPGAWE